MRERLYKPWSIRPTPIMSCLLLELVCLFGYLSITAAYSCHLGGLAGTFRTAFYSYLSDLPSAAIATAGFAALASTSASASAFAASAHRASSPSWVDNGGTYERRTLFLERRIPFTLTAALRTILGMVSTEQRRAIENDMGLGVLWGCLDLPHLALLHPSTWKEDFETVRKECEQRSNPVLGCHAMAIWGEKGL